MRTDDKARRVWARLLRFCNGDVVAADRVVLNAIARREA